MTTSHGTELLEYEIVDVFTERRFAGNPLAIVHGADHLSDGQLQALAREFNLSETTFPWPMTASDVAAGADYRVRIFTPSVELPWAGHPTLGTAWSLARRGVIGAGSRQQICGAGLIGLDVPADPDAPVELTATPHDRARPFSDADTVQLAELVALARDDVAGSAYIAGAGLTWTYLPIRADALSRSRTVGLPLAETDVDLSGIVDPVDGIAAIVVGETGDDGVVPVECRAFVPGLGVPEDPATGSAAAGLGLVLVAMGVAVPDGETAYRISQGVDMGRPSTLRGRVEATGGVATRVHVSGSVRPAATGQIRVPER